MSLKSEFTLRLYQLADAAPVVDMISQNTVRTAAPQFYASLDMYHYRHEYLYEKEFTARERNVAVGEASIFYVYARVNCSSNQFSFRKADDAIPTVI